MQWKGVFIKIKENSQPLLRHIFRIHKKVLKNNLEVHYA